jgi:predicted NACHT family NTPase
MPRYSYGDDLKERVWNLLEALLSQVNAELEGGGAVEGVLLKPSWHKGNSDRPTLEVKAQLADLSKLSKLSKGKLSIDDVRDALRHYLPEFLGILEDKRERKQGKGSENWHFILTLWSTELQENQKQFNAVWERKKSRETDVPDVPPSSTTNDNWHNICRTSLEKQKRLTTNRLMHAKQMRFDINQICVDLALVERKQPDKRSGDDNPERSQLYKPDYEETQKLEYEEFLATVLKASPSNKISVIGEPGAGKTTLLQRIAFWILDNTNGLPIWIPLGNLPTPAPKLKHYLLHNWLEDAILNVTPKIRLSLKNC